MTDASTNNMSYKESCSLWWSIFWRTMLISIFPILFLNLILVNSLGVSDPVSTLIINLLWIPVTIAIQSRVINGNNFKGFSIKIIRKGDHE